MERSVGSQSLQGGGQLLMVPTEDGANYAGIRHQRQQHLEDNDTGCVINYDRLGLPVPLDSLFHTIFSRQFRSIAARFRDIQPAYRRQLWLYSWQFG